MKKCFKVAGHRFAIVMPEDYSAWGEMSNYEPFVVDDSDDVIFEAKMLDVMPDTSSKRLVIKGTPKPEFPLFTLYELDGEWMVELAFPLTKEVLLTIFCDRDFADVRFYVGGAPKFAVNNVLMLMFAFSTARRNTLLMHASVTMYKGIGYLFLGKSGTGKSTHSQLWINNIEGCDLLNDDNPAIRVEDDGEVNVYGTPWSGKTPCYRNLVVPVGAIVDLHQAPQNEIRQLSLAEAYAVIYVSFSGYRFIKDMTSGQHATTEKIVTSVPCYSLNCLPDADAAFLCHNTVMR